MTGSWSPRDFDAYAAAQREVDALLAAISRGWNASAIRNTAHVGWFSSDRTIREYARDIWGVPCEAACDDGAPSKAAARRGGTPIRSRCSALHAGPAGTSRAPSCPAPRRVEAHDAGRREPLGDARPRSTTRASSKARSTGERAADPLPRRRPAANGASPIPTASAPCSARSTTSHRRRHAPAAVTTSSARI